MLVTALWRAAAPLIPLIVGIVMLAIPTVRLPADDLGFRHFRTPDISVAPTLSQTFAMTADDFHAIELSATSTGRASGDVRFELYDVTDGVRFVGRAKIPAADLVKAPSYRLEFPPIRDSKDQRYRLDVFGSEANPPKGVALLATKGERYGGGTMLFNERERWADLAFRTFAPAGRSGWTRLVSMPSGESGRLRRYLILAALCAYWILFGMVLRMMWTLPDVRLP